MALLFDNKKVKQNLNGNILADESTLLVDFLSNQGQTESYGLNINKFKQNDKVHETLLGTLIYT